MSTQFLQTDGATIAYDVVGPLPAGDGRPPLLIVGQPMTAEGFATLVTYFPERTVVTYDPRGLGRSTRDDGAQTQTPEQQSDDLHALVGALGGGPVEIFASSGGAVSSLALVARYPGDVSTLVAHEPPVISVLPDAAQAFAAESAWQATYREKGAGWGMAQFIAATSWHGPYTDDFLAQPAPDPSQFGMPADDDGSRDDPLLAGVANAITGYRVDTEAVNAAPTRVVVAVGVESKGTFTARTSEGVASALGLPLTEFPSHHGGFLGGEHGYAGQPEAFAARLHEVLDDGAE
jgi:pimeloyl-ACP methyl ester carboxylesterase